MTNPPDTSGTHTVGIVIKNIVEQQLGATERMFAWLMSSPILVPIKGIQDKLVVSQTIYDSVKKQFTVESTETPEIYSASDIDVINPEKDSEELHYFACVVGKDVVDIMGVNDALYAILAQSPVFVNLTSVNTKVFYGETTYDAEKKLFTNPDDTTVPVPTIGNIALLG